MTSSLMDAVYVPVWVALVVAIPQIVGTVLQFFTHLRINELEKNTNSITDKLVKLTGKAEFAKGVKSEQDKSATSPDLSEEK